MAMGQKQGFGYSIGLGGVSDWIAPRRNAMLGLASGLLQGPDLSSGLAQGFQNAAQGRQADDAYAKMQAEEAARQQQIAEAAALKTKYSEFFQQQGRPDLAQAVADGLAEPGEVYMEYIKPKDAAANAPANVQEWEYFSNLSPEDQSQYLTMKRSVPFLDQGTQYGRPDPLTGVVGPVVPKDNFQESFDTASGTAAGKAKTEGALGAPAAISSAENSLSQIDAVINDPNLPLAIGIGGLLPALPNSPQAGTVARIEQLQGAAFLQAFETLKGGGQITEVEGKKATDAIARLNRVQNKEDFIQALADLRAVVAAGLERAKAKLNSAPVGGGAVNQDIEDILSGYGL